MQLDLDPDTHTQNTVESLHSMQWSLIPPPHTLNTVESLCGMHWILECNAWVEGPCMSFVQGLVEGLGSGIGL